MNQEINEKIDSIEHKLDKFGEKLDFWNKRMELYLKTGIWISFDKEVDENVDGKLSY